MALSLRIFLDEDVPCKESEFQLHRDRRLSGHSEDVHVAFAVVGLIFPILLKNLHVADPVHLEYLVGLLLEVIAPYGLVVVSEGERLYDPVPDLAAVRRTVAVENDLSLTFDSSHERADIGGVLLLGKDLLRHDLLLHRLRHADGLAVDPDEGLFVHLDDCIFVWSHGNGNHLVVIHRGDPDIGHDAEVEDLLRLVCDVADISVHAFIATARVPFHILDVIFDAFDVSEVIDAKIERTADACVQECADSAKDGALLDLLPRILRCVEERCLELLTVIFDTEICSVLILKVGVTFRLDGQTLDDLTLDDVLH